MMPKAKEMLTVYDVAEENIDEETLAGYTTASLGT